MSSPVLPSSSTPPVLLDAGAYPQQAGDESESTLDMIFQALGLADRAEHNASEEQKYKELNHKKYDQGLPHLLRLSTQVGKVAENGYLTVQPQFLQVLKTHTSTKASVRLYSFLKQYVPPNPVMKLHVFMGLLRLLIEEVEFIKTAKEYIQTGAQNRELEKLLFEHAPARFVGNLYFVTFPKWDLSTRDGFACYLRFTQKIRSTVAPNIAKELTLNDKKVLKNMVKRGDASARAQATFLAVKCRQSDTVEKFHAIGDRVFRAMNQSNVTLCEMPVIQAMYKNLAPAFSYLLSLQLDRYKNTWPERNYSVETHPDYAYYLPVMESFMQGLLQGPASSYFSRQAELYKTAYQYLQDMLRNNPDLKSEIGKLDSPDAFLARSVELQSSLQPAPLPNHSLQEKIIAELMQSELKAAPMVVAPKGTQKRPIKKQDVPAQVKEESVAQALEVSHLALLLCSALQKPSVFRLHERVTRWLKVDTTNLEAIRQFTDSKEGQIAALYEKLSSEELHTQLILHGFTPVIDKLLSNDFFREKYSMQTSRGRSLFIEFIRQGRPAQKGVIGYGLDGNFCFHRKIDIKETLDFQNTTLEKVGFFDAQRPDNGQQELFEELNSGFEGDSVDLDPELELIKCTDRKNGCQLILFPLS